MGIKPTKRVKFKGTWDEKSNADRRKVNEKLKKMKATEREQHAFSLLLPAPVPLDVPKGGKGKEKGKGKELIAQEGGYINTYMNRHDGGMAKKTRTF